VLLVHGWGGRGSQLGAFVAPLVAQGFSAVAFDGPGHGASPSRAVTIPEMVAALRAVAAEHGPIAGLVAHSAGAIVSARALYEGLAVDAAVFIASAADLRGASESFAGAFGLSRRVREAMQARIERRVGVPWSAFEVARLAPAVAVPLLVAHDRDDGEVPWHHGRSIATAWPGAELVVTGGLGHRRILRDPDVIAHAVSFVTARVAERSRRPLPAVAAPEPVAAQG
jgi:pimeloyl-ACP methyl ester carboxylesterase